MFIILGILFIAYEGTSALSGLYESYGATDLTLAAELRAESLYQSMPGVPVLAVLAVLGATLLLAHRRGASKKGDSVPESRRRDKGEVSK